MTQENDRAVVPHPLTMDPACGAVVDPAKQPPTTSYRDKRYSFCSMECRAAFDRNPAAFVGRPVPAAVTERPLPIGAVARYAAAAFLLVVALPFVLGLILGSRLLAFAFVAAALFAGLALAARFTESGGVRS